MSYLDMKVIWQNGLMPYIGVSFILGATLRCLAVYE